MGRDFIVDELAMAKHSDAQLYGDFRFLTIRSYSVLGCYYIYLLPLTDIGKPAKRQFTSLYFCGSCELEKALIIVWSE